MNGNKYTIALLDASEIILGGLQTIVENHKHFVAERYETLPFIAKRDVNIVVLNPLFVVELGWTKIKEYFPNAKFVALIYNYTERDLRNQFDAVIEVNDTVAHIISTLEGIVNLEPNKNSDTEEISDREKEILIAVAKGMTSKEIAHSHNISIHTVITHRRNIVRKTGIKTVSGLLVYALLNNLIEETEVLK